jgi:coenzyme Q-binding protein COQ10
VPVVTVSEHLPLPPEAVYAKVADMEAYPVHMRTVRSIEVLERGPGRTVTRWTADLGGGRLIRWDEEDLFFPEEGRIRYRLVKGDLKTFQGEWRVEPEAEGTRLTLTVEFEFGLPMLASLLNPVGAVLIRRNMEAMLQGIQEALGPP